MSTNPERHRGSRHMAIAAHPQASAGATNGHEPADVLVVFGITGDLAKVMTFNSLYRLEQRGLVDCPIVGVAVDDWTVDDLRARARTSIEAGGGPVDEAVFERLAERMSYVQGDFGDPATFARVGDAIHGAQHPVFYLEIPPFLFGKVVAGLADAGLTENARVVVEKPFGPRRRVGARAQRRDPQPHPRGPAVPDRPFPREDGPRRDPLPEVRELDLRADLEPPARGVRADHDGRGLRGRGSRPLLRPGRRRARRGRQPPDAGRRRCRDGAAVEPARPQGCVVRRVRRHARGGSRALRARAIRRLPRHRRESRRTPRPRPMRRSGWRSTTGGGRASRSTSVPASTCRSRRPSCA